MSEPEASAVAPDPASTLAGWAVPVRTRRRFEIILDQLEGALLSGQLVAGARMPPERELAAALCVSRTSVREALRVLEALGMVTIQRGPSGVTLRREPGNAFAEILRLHLALGHYALSSTVELRGVLEAWAFARVARNPDPDLLLRLHEIVLAMNSAGIEPSAFHELDVSFHSLVVDACQNDLAPVILRGLRTAVRREMLSGLTAGPWEETVKVLIDEHCQLYNALERQDESAAAQLVQRHISRWASVALTSKTI